MLNIIPFINNSVEEQLTWVTPFFQHFCLPEKDSFETFLGWYEFNSGHFYELVRRLSDPKEDMGVFVGSGLSAPYAFPSWYRFLTDAAAELGLSDLISDNLAAGKLPEVAEQLENTAGEAFEQIIIRTFSHTRVAPRLLDCAGLLTFLPFKTVITTNFDYVLEEVYRLAGRPLQPVLYGAKLAHASRALEEGLRPLVKIHGDYLHDRILTRTQYSNWYGRDSALMDTLIGMFSQRSFTFVGFSFQDTEIKLALREAHSCTGRLHYALLYGKPEDRLYDLEELYACGIRPIFYGHDYALVGQLLGFIVEGITPDTNLIKLATYFQAELYGAVVGEAERLVRLRPNCLLSRIAYINCLLSDADYTRINEYEYVNAMISRVDRAIGAAPDFTEAYALRAIYNAMRFDLKNACADLTRASETDSPLRPYLLAQRGLYALFFPHEADIHNPTRALNDLKEAADLIDQKDPTLPLLDLYIACIEYGFGNRELLRLLPERMAELSARSPEQRAQIEELNLKYWVLNTMARTGIFKKMLKSDRLTRFSTRTVIRLLRAGFIGVK